MSYKKLANEGTPLISPDSLPTKNVQTNSVLKELMLVVKIAIPIIITNLSTFLMLTESIIITGQLSKVELDACALANSVINVAGLAVGTGLCTACDTFFSQMYGSKHRKSIGTILIKCAMIISLFPIVLIAFHINMEGIFVKMGQSLEVSVLAARYMTYFSPGLIFGFNFLILTRYMQNQSRVLPPMIIGIFINVVNVTSQYLAVHYFKIGIDASPICQAASFFLFWLIQLLYIVISKLYKDTWDGWSPDVFLDWKSFTRLAIPGAAMVVMECTCFEIGTILSGIMGEVELAAQSVLFQIETITFMMSFGVGIAVNIRVGQHLGSGQPLAALKSYRCGMLAMFISFCICFSIILGLKDYLPIVFTNDKNAQQMSTDLLPFLVGVQFFDAFGTVTMGALRGCGRQKICVLIIFCSYYLLGQPIGISLAFAAGMNVKGIWIGLLISLAICVPVAVIYTNFIQDWQHQSDLCQKRITEAMIQQQREEMKSELFEQSGSIGPSKETFSTSHGRSLSKSFSAKSVGDVMVTKYIATDNKTYMKAYKQKSAIYIVAICILIAGVLVHVLLPKSSYWPENHNKTIN